MKKDLVTEQMESLQVADEEVDSSKEPTSALLEFVAENVSTASRIDGVVTGRIASIDTAGIIRVSFPGAPREGCSARVATPLHATDVGSEVALMFEGGNPSLPIVIGKLVSPPMARNDAETIVDGRRVEINADEEIVLRCGESSITLTRAGKIIIRGTYVLSRSSGVNRIQGGSVEIN